MHSLIERYRDRLPVDDSTPVVSLGEGSTPLLHAPRISRAARRRAVPQVGGCEPDRELQGPRDDGGRLEGRRSRRPLGHLRVHREHGRLGGRLRRARRARRRRPPAGGRRRVREARAGTRPRRTRARGARELRRGARRGARARRTRDARARQLAEPRPPRGPEDRRVRDRRGRSAAPPTCSPCRTAAAGTSRRTRAGSRRAARECRRSSAARRPSGRRPSRPRSASWSLRTRRPSTLRCRRSGGTVVSLSDDAILEAWQELAHAEGVFCEPASAAGLAALADVELEPGLARRLRRHRPRAEGSRDGRAPQPGARDRRPGPGCDRGGVEVTAVRVRAPATHGEPRPGLRLCRRGARPVERARGHGRRRRARRRPSRRPRVRAARAGRRSTVRVRRPDPARARARIECRGDRARARRRSRVAEGCRARARRSCSHEGSRARGPRRQPGGRPRRGRRASRGTSGSRDSPTTRRPFPSRSSPRPPSRTAAARAALPEQVAHGDAVVHRPRAPRCSERRSRRGSADLFAEALDDRLHEPYRAAARAAPRRAVRDDLPPARSAPRSRAPARP